MPASKVDHYITANQRHIYTFSVEAFTGLIANIYFVEDGDAVTMVDTGSMLESSTAGILTGMEALKETYHIRWGLADLDTILITHGHIDHYGGLPFLRQYTDAPVGVHVLDQRILSNHQERVRVAAQRLRTFLLEAGVPAKDCASLMRVYLWAKDQYVSQPVDFLLSEAEPAPHDMVVYHVPGHCPGQVCLQVDDILLTADHVLSVITPHQAPESIINHMGLGHYLDSLDKIAQLEGIRLGLGGHEAPIVDVQKRIARIKRGHEKRLNRVLDICRQPCTIAEISHTLFGGVKSYHVLLALEEAGAHVEYLYQRGELIAGNLDEIEQAEVPVIQYVRT